MFEYKIIQTKDTAPAHMENLLNDYGKQGWECIQAIFISGSLWFFVLKRKID